MSRVGLVLGAGGIVGHAFHAGVLRALAEATGWDPHATEVIVGTSAGSHVAALLRAGLSPADLAARVADEPLSVEGTALLRKIGPAETVPAAQIRSLRMAAPRLLLRTTLRPWTARPGVLTAAVLPQGRVSLEPFAARLRWLFDGWSKRPLWVPAVRLTDGRRVVFGRPGEIRTDVGTAVAASCAVPGWFQPVRIDGASYVDGGVHSLSNADLLAGMGLDLVVVVSPMSVARGAWRPAAALTGRASLRLQLGEEVARIRRSGTPVVTFQPTAADLDVMGFNAMSSRHSQPVVRQAYESALGRLARPDHLAQLAALTPERMGGQ